MNRITMNGYTRISKTEAKRRFNTGENVLFTPCNLRPGERLFGLSILANIDDWGLASVNPRENRFDTMVNEFTWYNCNSETGRYITYYKEV